MTFTIHFKPPSPHKNKIWIYGEDTSLSAMVKEPSYGAAAGGTVYKVWYPVFSPIYRFDSNPLVR